MKRLSQLQEEIGRIFGLRGPLAGVFPGYQLREGQIEMARRVLEALHNDERILVEAGTGTGKTFAYLVPILLSGKKVVLSTGTRHLQDQVFLKDLPALKPLMPSGFQAVLMKGRENYLCVSRFRDFSLNPTFFRREESAYLEKIIGWAEQTDRGDRAELEGLPEDAAVWKDVSATSNQCTGKSCADYDICYITRMRRKMEEAQLIIVNHHLYFADLALREESFGQVLPDHDAVIFDEAHLMEEVASEYFGAAVSPYQVMELAGDARRELKGMNHRDPASWDQLERLYRRSDDFFNLFVPEEGSEKRFRLPPPARLAGSLERIKSFLNILEWLEAFFLAVPGKTEGCQKISERASQLRAVSELLVRQEDPTRINWGELTPAVQLRATPVAVAEVLRSSLFATRKGMVFTSATLTVEERFDYIKNRTGIPADREFLFPSPFDYASSCLVYLPPGLPEPASDLFLEAAGAEIVRILEQTSGRAFVLCTSHKNKDYFHRYCQERLKYLCLKQGDGSKMELLKVFRDEVSSVLFATQGFWQGVDVRGESLSCVIIDRLPFASPTDPVVEARIGAIRRENRNPFMEYQVPWAVLMLKQGLGRLIRGEQDRGLLSILDSRIVKKAYGKVFMASLPPCRVTSDIGEVGKFFRV